MELKCRTLSWCLQGTAELLGMGNTLTTHTWCQKYCKYCSSKEHCKGKEVFLSPHTCPSKHPQFVLQSTCQLYDYIQPRSLPTVSSSPKSIHATPLNSFASPADYIQKMFLSLLSISTPTSRAPAATITQPQGGCTTWAAALCVTQNNQHDLLNQ